MYCLRQCGGLNGGDYCTTYDGAMIKNGKDQKGERVSQKKTIAYLSILQNNGNGCGVDSATDHIWTVWFSSTPLLLLLDSFGLDYGILHVYAERRREREIRPKNLALGCAQGGAAWEWNASDPHLNSPFSSPPHCHSHSLNRPSRHASLPRRLLTESASSTFRLQSTVPILIQGPTSVSSDSSPSPPSPSSSYSRTSETDSFDRPPRPWRWSSPLWPSRQLGWGICWLGSQWRLPGGTQIAHTTMPCYTLEPRRLSSGSVG